MYIETNEETGETVGTGNDARVAMLEAIGQNNDTERGEDLQEFSEDGSLAENEVSAYQPNVEVVDEPQMFTLRVNGRDIQVTQDELIARAQKVEAADEYLREAARLRNDATQKLSQDASPVDDDLALARAIQMGNEEEAVAAIRALKSKGPSQDDLNRTIDERLTFNEAISKFRTEYSDIITDPYLNKLALDMDAQMLASGDNRDYYTRYKEVGDKLRNWVGGIAAPVQGKVERKASAPSTPRVSGGKAAAATTEEKEESVSDIIAQMAAKRGGPQWMSGMSS